MNKLSRLYNFCILTNINYMARALALYDSILNFLKEDEFRLYYYCFDNDSFNILSILKCKAIIPIRISDIEDDDLLLAKTNRTTQEYFFTLSSWIIWHSITTFNLDHCTYLDADICFYSSPKPLYEELGKDSVLITEHDFSKDFLHQQKYGRFCVQYVTFKSDECGMKILNDWKKKCLEWCYLVAEPSRFADQKYLDEWPEKFKGVRISQNKGAGLAPWNKAKYTLSINDNKLVILSNKDKKTYDVIFYHFQGLRFHSDNTVNFRTSYISGLEKKILYKPYVNKLIKIDDHVKKIYKNVDTLGKIEPPTKNWKSPFKFFFRKYFQRIYNIYDLEEIL